MAVTLYVVTLFLVARVCIGLTTSNIFNIAKICETPYGVVMETSQQRSSVACATRCQRNTSCLSFTFHPMNYVCRMNAHEIPMADVSCSLKIEYGYWSTSTLNTTAPTNLPLNASYNGDRCTVNTDCVEPLSECRLGICQCLEAYVYNYTSHSCVFITACSSYGTTFQTIGEREYRGMIVDEVFDISEGDCVSRCITATTYLCHLISYDQKVGGGCLLFDLQGLSQNAILADYDPEAENIVYQRDCAVPASMIQNQCMSDNECVDRNSACFTPPGHCSCHIGLSYDDDKHACVHYCPMSSEFTFQAYLATNVLDFIYQDQKNNIINENDCMVACLNNVNIECRSAIADKVRGVCLMSNETFGIYPPTSIVEDTAFGAMQTDCESMRPAIEKTFCYGGGCTALDSECRDGRCKCLIGFSYTETGDMCTPTCSIYGRTFQTIRDHFVTTFSDNTLPMVSGNVITECKVACLEEFTFTCLMAFIDIPLKKCALFGTSLYNIPLTDRMTGATGFITFQRDCRG